MNAPLRRTAALIALATALLASLRLSGVIAWPWWQVLSPAWIPAAAVIYLLLAIAVGRMVKR